MQEILPFDHLCELFSYTPKGRPISSKEVAELLGLHPATLDAFRVRGDGPRYFSPPGTRRVWYSERDVLEWMASGERQSTSEIGHV
ncbi:MAG: DNA-binding protein [Proteobacteria bacterium]|nr:DNA-binding protein [Pseudomonadota bacterium]